MGAARLWNFHSRGGGSVGLLAGLLSRSPLHIASPGVSQVGELLIQQHAGLMRCFQLRLGTAGSRGGWLSQRTNPAAAPGSPTTVSASRAAGADGHVEIRLRVIEAHGPLFIDRVQRKLKRNAAACGASTSNGLGPTGVRDGHEFGGDCLSQLRRHTADVVVALTDVPPVLSLWVDLSE